MDRLALNVNGGNSRGREHDDLLPGLRAEKFQKSRFSGTRLAGNKNMFARLFNLFKRLFELGIDIDSTQINGCFFYLYFSAR